MCDTAIVLVSFITRRDKLIECTDGETRRRAVCGPPLSGGFSGVVSWGKIEYTFGVGARVRRNRVERPVF
jgi:hypothetical protein